MAEENYHQTIARMRQERAQREHLNRLENIQIDYREAARERETKRPREAISMNSRCEIRIVNSWSSNGITITHRVSNGILARSTSCKSIARSVSVTVQPPTKQSCLRIDMRFVRAIQMQPTPRKTEWD